MRINNRQSNPTVSNFLTEQIKNKSLSENIWILLRWNFHSECHSDNAQRISELNVNIGSFNKRYQQSQQLIIESTFSMLIGGFDVRLTATTSFLSSKKRTLIEKYDFFLALSGPKFCWRRLTSLIRLHSCPLKSHFQWFTEVHLDLCFVIYFIWPNKIDFFWLKQQLKIG